MIPIPKYIEKYAIEKKQKNSRLYLTLKCDCGCEEFYLYKNKYTSEEKEQIKEYESNIPKTGLHSIYYETDENGEVYSYIKIFGLFKKKIIYPKAPMCMLVKVIKATCKDCKKEILVFDNRFYGYDGTTSQYEEERKYSPNFKKISNECYKVEIIIENDNSSEEFNEAIGKKCNSEFYSNSFSWIRINKIDEKGKRTIIEDLETS